MTSTITSWPEAIYRLFRTYDITQVAYVPDAGHSKLISLSQQDTQMQAVVLTSEEEGIAMLAGAHLGGARGVLLMQSSGVGNCINMLSLTKTAAMPLFCLVSMRGEFGEGNPWQLPMGQAVEPVLRAMGVNCLWVYTEAQVEPTVNAGLTMAFKAGQAVAVLLSQRLIGAKAF